MAKKSTKTKQKSVKGKKSFSHREFLLYILVFAVVGAFTLWVSLAAPANKGGGKPGSTSFTGSFVGPNPVMVTDNNSDGLINYGDTITFNVTANAQFYFVSLVCIQNGTIVDQQSNGFYVGWPWSKNYLLHSTAWNGGAADCTATLNYQAATKRSTTYPTLATMTFHVNA